MSALSLLEEMCKRRDGAMMGHASEALIGKVTGGT